MQNHRKILQATIIAVVAILIVWSIVNVSAYAYIYHPSVIVATLGIALGAANALSVYAFVIAKGAKVKWPAGVGIALFGGASGTLQMLLYLHDGAPLAAALTFGWIGPVAEAVLSWLHAALSEEESAAGQAPAQIQGEGVTQPARKVRKEKAQPEQESATQSAADQPEQAQPEQEDNASVALPSFALQAQAMKANGMSIEEIATQLRKSKRSVNNYLAQAKALGNGHSLEEKAQ